MQLEVMGSVDKADLPALTATEAFNAPFDAYERDCYERYTKDLTDEQRAEVAEWRGVSTTRPGFWDVVSKPAHHAILNLIAAGLG